MSSGKRSGRALLGFVLATSAAAAVAPAAGNEQTQVAALWDPAYLARSLCRADSATKFKPSIRLASAAGSASNVGDAEPPLWDNLGDLIHPITTTDARAQRYFDQGLRLSYAFNHAEARRAFRAAQRIDPNCAACYWGEALVLGPNINAPMDPAATELALAAVARAKTHADRASGR